MKERDKADRCHISLMGFADRYVQREEIKRLKKKACNATKKKSQEGTGDCSD